MEISVESKKFSVRLKAARLKQGLNQVSLAKLLGVSAGAVGNWESTGTGATPANLKKISELLGCSIEWLLGGNEVGPGALETISRAPKTHSGTAVGNNLQESATPYHTRPLLVEIREHVERFLAQCGGNQRRLGWMLVELQEHFPLNKHPQPDRDVW